MDGWTKIKKNGQRKKRRLLKYSVDRKDAVHKIPLNFRGIYSIQCCADKS
jgi:hypothetical protein